MNDFKLPYYFCHYQSPLGEVTLQATDSGLTGAWFETQTTQPNALGRHQIAHPILKLTIKQLSDYFSGQLTEFALPLAANGTSFQQQVWQSLNQIPYASTWSYQQLADQINNPKAVRAVGMANGKNPISIIVPCHRVIAKNGKLTGYAGGIERKQWLIEHEKSVISAAFRNLC